VIGHEIPERAARRERRPIVHVEANPIVVRIDGGRAHGSRVAARTSKPALFSRAKRCPPTNPVAPVSSTVPFVGTARGSVDGGRLISTRFSTRARRAVWQWAGPVASASRVSPRVGGRTNESFSSGPLIKGDTSCTLESFFP
jgi:hypothetical protein